MSDTPDDSDEEPPVDDATGAAASDDPFAELENVEVEADPFDSWADLEKGGGDEPFTEVAVSDIDESSVWEELGAAADSEPDVAVGDELPDVTTDQGEAIVPKRSYCETCEYFAAPPETTCTNPRTEILELVDLEHFRVANCPVVAKRRGLDYDDLPADD